MSQKSQYPQTLPPSSHWLNGISVSSISSIKAVSSFSMSSMKVSSKRNGTSAESLFLGIAMVTLKLWELTDLALPLVVMLTGQLILMLLFARFVIFNAMGRDYDAAVLTAGACGFGMGATPNAMANMQAVCSRYHYSVQAFLLIPIVGSMFVDFLNSMAVTTLINIIS